MKITRTHHLFGMIGLCFFFLAQTLHAQNPTQKLKTCVLATPPEPITLAWGAEDNIYSSPPANADFKNASYVNKLIQDCWIPSDSVVFEVFTRNFEEWENAIIVIDWTASMYPYGVQVMVWLELHKKYQDYIKGVIFFNDGDHKQDFDKIIGKTGGIYFCSLANASQTMALVAQRGAGGDIPENDLEAVLGGMKKCPDCQHVILIADSRSMVRDLELVVKMSRNFPNTQVHTILCGVKEHDDFVLDYLTIGTFTQGSVHTIEQDFELLHLLKKNQVLKIEGKSYRLKNGLWEVWSDKKK